MPTSLTDPSAAETRLGFGLSARDPQFIAQFAPAARWFRQHYARLEVEGAEHLRTRPALLVANHNGGLVGSDLICTLSLLWDTLGVATPTYALAHDFVMRHLSFLGRVMARGGALRASPESAREALLSGASCLVYPGGDLDSFRTWALRHRIVLGERTGFIRTAQRLRVPIVPIVSQGAHSNAIILNDGALIAKAFRMKKWARLERFPIALCAPWGLSMGPVPYLPLPMRVRMRILPPMMMNPDAEPEQLREEIRATMQAAMDDMCR